MDLDLLKVNISQFDENVSFISEDGTLDVDSVVSAYESEQANADQDQEQDITQETEDSTQTNDDVSDDDGVQTETQPQPQTQKRTPDQAFAEMRRKAEQYEHTAKWVQDLATQQGFKSAEELIQAYEDQKIAKEAEAQGVPVDVYKRLHQLETENKRTKEEMIASQFNSEVQQVIDKYGLSDEQLQDVFVFMGQNGYNAGDIPFEQAYILANHETLIQDAEERGKQKYLENLQKKQKQATPNIKGGTTDNPPTDELDYSKEGIFATLDKMGISYD